MINNIFILDKQYKTKKILTVDGKNTFFEDLYTQDLSTGTESYEFYTNVQDIEESDYIMFYYHEQYKLFQIIEIEMEHSEGNIITYCYGESACLELLNSAVRPFEGEYNALLFFNHILQGTEWSIGVYSTPLADKVVSVKVSKTTQVWSCIQDYMSEFRYELNTRVIYENGNVKYKLIDIYAEGELGERTYKRFEFGRNVEGIVKKKDLYDWCTALIIESDEDITDLEYSDENGFTKSKGSDVILATKENQIYNNGKPYIYGSFEDDSPSGQESLESAVKELKNRCVPKFDYECDTILTYEEYNQINIGDTVYVIDNSFAPSILLEARVGKLELSFTNRNDCKCNLTNYKEIKSKIDVTLTGSIQGILDSYFPIGSNQIGEGAVKKEHLNYAFIEELEAELVVANKIIVEELIAEEIKAVSGEFEDLKAQHGEFEDLVTNNFTANNADITNLKASFADISLLVNGHLTSDNIQSLILTADKVTIADALIKNAMIDSIDASKINTGVINTNTVSIQSEDGGITLSDETLQFKDGDTVRIQIGKDETGNFTFVLYDKDGQGVLIDETGIKSSAIADGLIRNDHISDNANISGGKLDISSLIESINNDGTKTIKSNKIYLDEQNQSLQVAFNQLSNKVESIEKVTIDGDLSSVIEQITTNTTTLQVQQGQISNLISNTTITKENGVAVSLKDEYSSMKQTVDGITRTIGSLETNYSSTLKTSSVQYYQSTSATSLSGGSWSDTAPQWVNGKYMWQRMKYTYTNGSVTYGTASCLSGAKGQDGAPGKGISKVVNYYLASKDSSGITTSTSGWTTTVQSATSSKPYLWNYEKTTYSDNSIIDTTPCIIGTYNAGAKGEEGKGIKSITEYYATSTKGDSAPSSWSTTVPSLTATNKYLWNYEVITYTDNTTYTSAKRVIGVYGDIGEKGQSIVSVTPQWYLSTSGTSQVNGSWIETMPSLSEGRYLWQRMKYTLANPSGTTYSNPVLEQIAEIVKDVRSKQAKMEESLDGFKTTVSSTYTTKEEMEKLQVGGRNLLLGTLENKTITGNNTTNQCTNLYKLIDSKADLGGIQLTLSFTFTVSNYKSGTFVIQSYSSVYNGFGSSITPKGNGTYTYTWTLTTGSAFSSNTGVQIRMDNFNGTIVISKMKLEKGNKATDWTRAQEDLQNEINSVDDYISEVEQTANKISWVVKSGTSQSSMTLTDKMYSLISSNITLKATNIDLHGYVTANGNFKIDTSGNMTAKNGTFSGNISASTITGGTITGTKIIGQGNGNRIVINNGDYEVQTGGTTKGFLGLRTLDDGFDTARLALSSTGLSRATDNYFVIVPYNKNANPQSYAYPYVDIAYRCHGFKGDDGVSDVSNIKMYGDGVMRISPIQKLEITTNYALGKYKSSSEGMIAEFGSCNDGDYDYYLDVRALRNTQNSNGLPLVTKRTDGASSNVAKIKLQVYSDGFRALRPIPAHTSAPHHLGSGSYRWQTVYSVNALNTSSDRTLKENIKYLSATPNARTIKDDGLTVQDMYDFIRDDLFLVSYNWIHDKEKDEKLGFIAQDIIDTKVGDKIIVCNRDRDDTLGYDSGNFEAVISGALQVAIQKIEQLEARIQELENK